MSDSNSQVPKMLYAFLAVAVAVWLFNLWNSDERRISRRLEGLRGVVEKSAGEGDLEAVNRGRKLGEFFAQSFQIQGEPVGVLTDRRQLGQVLVQYRRQTDNIGLGFTKQELRRIDGGRKSAEMELVATLSSRNGSDLRRASYRLFFLWVEEDGTWVIERLELLEVLEGNPFF